MAAAEADGEASTDVARSPGGDLELLSNQGAAGGGGGGKWKHQSTAAARTWLSRPQLSAAEGTTVGSHQDPIHRFTESRLKCGPRQILAQNLKKIPSLLPPTPVSLICTFRSATSVPSRRLKPFRRRALQR